MPRGRRKLVDKPVLAKHTVILNLSKPEQAYANEQIESMKDHNEWQEWFREKIVELLPMPAHPRSNGHLEERYADPEDSA